MTLPDGVRVAKDLLVRDLITVACIVAASICGAVLEYTCQAPAPPQSSEVTK